MESLRLGSRTRVQFLVDHMRACSRGEIDPHMIDHGLCYITQCAMRFNGWLSGEHYGCNDAYRIVSHYAKQWPYFSGEVEYPVPDPNGLKSPIDIYNNEVDPMWKYGAYAELRRNLAGFIADKLEDYLKQYPTEEVV